MRIKKLGTLLATGAMALSLMGACGNAPAKTSEATQGSGSSGSSLSGQITAAGSSALLPLAKAAAADFMKTNPGVTITVSGGGSGTGLKQVSDKAVTIGNSDVFAEEKLKPEQAKALVDHQVATITMAAVVNKNLAIDNLSTADLVKVFTGQAKNWKEVGGPDQQIILVTRPSSSGTRALFQKYALNGQEEASNAALETDNSGTLIQNVAQNPGAIGYVALSYTQGNNQVKPISLNNVKPTLENTNNGTYPVWGYEHMYTNGEPDAATKAYLDYMMSDTFGATLEKMGYGVASKLSDKAKASHK
ncbi:MAG: phosphate ABC transporter substrate-binding protein [Arcanobacterium sp.]|nr:phosphate ABC transporter substrate-binding protein [Arcanobacterium sp.]